MKLRFVAQIAALFASSIQVASATPSYSIRELPAPASNQSITIESLNDKGDALTLVTEAAFDEEVTSYSIRLANGSALQMPGMRNTILSGLHLTNHRQVFGTSYNLPLSRIGLFTWKPGFSRINDFTDSLGLLEDDDSYMLGNNDLGLAMGYTESESFGIRGFLVDTNTGVASFNPHYRFGSLNDQGTFLRVSPPAHGNDPQLVEVVRRSQTMAIHPPALTTIQFEDLQVAPNDQVYGHVYDQNPADGITGLGSECVVWSGPTFQPIVITPPNKTQADYCLISGFTSDKQMVVLHNQRIGEDEYRVHRYVYLNGKFTLINQLAPKLKAANQIWVTDMNAQGQIAVNAWYAGHGTRAFLLTPSR